VRRVSITVRGVVQGVGFRPFVHRAATRRRLTGWVQNRSGGVSAEVQGAAPDVCELVDTLRRAAPAGARVESIEVVDLPLAEVQGFRILPSVRRARSGAILPADIATCAICSRETATPGERRFRHAFASCASCGPRYSIVEALPYDRPRTTMRAFAMCPACAREYRDADDRRFHAQAVACPACGPTLRLLSPEGREIVRGEPALQSAIEALRGGRIVALKGLGGYQLVADAGDPAAVAQLRARKRRSEKPFAVLFASVAAAREVCEVSRAEESALSAPQAPILLLDRSRTAAGGAMVTAGVAPGSPRLGAMLPCTPLHRFLVEGVGGPLVCTSGNLSEEPICIDDRDALLRLAGIADVFLAHDRLIARPIDDSVARVGPGGVEVLRRARGFTPLPISVPGVPAGIVALGAQLKSTVAVTLEDEVVVSQHLGDLHLADASELLERTVGDLVRLLGVRPRIVAADLHPDYASSRLAERLAAQWGLALERVQHHHAHVAACLAEHGFEGSALGLVWDGAGLGPDGTLWGGEALLVRGAVWRRVAHLRPFRLAGGERAIAEPWRAALGLLALVSRADALAWATRRLGEAGARVTMTMLDRGVNAPVTTSIGRLFDAVAALAGLRDVNGFEAQAAIELENAAADEDGAEPYPLPLGSGEPAVADWAPLVAAVLADVAAGTPVSLVAARFHAALAVLAEETAVRAAVPQVVLTGGCFQNLRLARDVRRRLLARGFAVLSPRGVPPNDGGISLGQAVVAALRMEERRDVSGNPR
jgi:hydrogenase maturation protein HypF